jgi:uncharacterized metal-binding protein (TIGR02443 family)
MKNLVQFIAGALCQSCKDQDTIAINADDDQIYCVKCDFVENRPKEISPKNDTIKVINIEDFKRSKR